MTIDVADRDRPLLHVRSDGPALNTVQVKDESGRPVFGCERVVWTADSNKEVVSLEVHLDAADFDVKGRAQLVPYFGYLTRRQRLGLVLRLLRGLARPQPPRSDPGTRWPSLAPPH
jgi:hypothetical protein